MYYQKNLFETEYWKISDDWFDFIFFECQDHTTRFGKFAEFCQLGAMISK